MTDYSTFTTLEAWQTAREAIRAKLWTLLGDMPPLFTPQITIDRTTQREGFALHHFTFDNGAGATVYGYLLIPDGLTQPAPAVLYHHVHGGIYDLGKEQLLTPHHTYGHNDGVELAQRGYVVLGIDAYCFGERTNQGSAGIRESGGATEMSLFKRFLWEGTCLWGMMVRDDLLALNILMSRPEVDQARVGATGMSLGASRTTWVGALDERIALTMPISQMTRYADLLAAGGLSYHSIYYYVPGVLKAGIDMEQIVSLTAPRQLVVLTGDSDPLSPFEGVLKVHDYTKNIYALYGAEDKFQITLYPGVDHAYTQQMFTDVISAFEQRL